MLMLSFGASVHQIEVSYQRYPSYRCGNFVPFFVSVQPGRLVSKSERYETLGFSGVDELIETNPTSPATTTSFLAIAESAAHIGPSHSDAASRLARCTVLYY